MSITEKRVCANKNKGAITWFVCGRNIAEAIRGLYDTIFMANNKLLTPIMLAIDFMNALDSIAFPFIGAVLRFFGF